MRALLKIYIIPISIMFFLYGCGGVKEKIGLIKRAPDEFQVYESKPLSVPPDFDLRPPVEGDMLTEESNEEIIFRNENNTEENLTLSDEILLIAVGEKETKVNIRKIINDDNSIEALDKSIIDKILDFDAVFEVKGDELSEEINPAMEKERIEKSKKEDQIIKGANDGVIIEKAGSLD
tara:strand:+ start:235 stop:768 length:534 start_codon:yes stop_codon:yes gene_type:complete